MKIDRLMGITIYLLNHGKTSAQMLAKKFEVSSRTIMRDMETLEKAGIPIESTCGADGGYQILDTYIMDRHLANPQDYSFISTALKGLASACTNREIEETLKKVNLLTEESCPIRLDFSVAREKQDINARIQILEEAIKKQRVVQFQYTNSKAEEKIIQTEPVGLVYKWYHWYFVGYYEKYKDYCMFKLARMEQLSVTNMANTRQHALAEVMAEHHDAKEEMVQVKLFGKARVKAKCREYLNGEITKEYENGDFEYSFTVPEYETFWYGVVLSCGADLKVLAPESVKERILTTCRAIIEEYGGK